MVPITFLVMIFQHFLTDCRTVLAKAGDSLHRDLGTITESYMRTVYYLFITNDISIMDVRHQADLAIQEHVLPFDQVQTAKTLETCIRSLCDLVEQYRANEFVEFFDAHFVFVTPCSSPFKPVSISAQMRRTLSKSCSGAGTNKNMGVGGCGVHSSTERRVRSAPSSPMCEQNRFGSESMEKSSKCLGSNTCMKMKRIESKERFLLSRAHTTFN